ncbi:DUF3450 domain-containing protein [Halomonas elongata]|uniref:DUF3450 domain-containing protein n=2 Tax=Halomonas elongata TaxID=2746 RepID=E1V4I7_HALED|nr:DUF3450 domain-containing protein [Halomonas elongata]MBW5799774.1 DUF3450 domain-containing protein [Halomonas elongata]OBX35792.1 hypothetical protein A8U91_00126 [Halomonas elongata]WBF16670.1 DUF3450 domain-containing protein [Halomonas elongata]WPU49111.1 DUF3450 domain-containing protein [Halomonas elongata DSM 2581]CBV42925.1 DUF3450 family protein [Halomonas elongata DSM 2581]
MPYRKPWIRWGVAGLALTLAASASAQSSLRDEALDAQRTQAELQERIDNADEAVREQLRELRQAREETRRLRAYNEELAPVVERQAATLEERRSGVESLAETREALPGMMREMVERLRAWVEHDMPFLRDERLARVASLESTLSAADLSSAEKLERVLAAWRAELDYGRELDAWRGELPGDTPREVNFLRIGRIGWYYLTPDGHQGGVWKAEAGEWQSLDESALAEIRKGLRIVREQRAPAMLDLPVSQPVEDAS